MALCRFFGTYVHIYIYIHICIFISIYIYMYMYIYVYMYIYIQIQIMCIHIHIHAYFSAVLKFLRKFWCSWVFLKRMQVLSRIHFRRHFIKCIAVETKQFVGNERGFSVEPSFTRHFIEFVAAEMKPFFCSNIHVILTRQTCGQRSSRAAESKRQALKKYFYERICHKFKISKCRGD